MSGEPAEGSVEEPERAFGVAAARPMDDETWVMPQKRPVQGARRCRDSEAEAGEKLELIRVGAIQPGGVLLPTGIADGWSEAKAAQSPFNAAAGGDAKIRRLVAVVVPGEAKRRSGFEEWRGVRATEPELCQDGHGPSEDGEFRAANVASFE